MKTIILIITLMYNAFCMGQSKDTVLIHTSSFDSVIWSGGSGTKAEIKNPIGIPDGHGILTIPDLQIFDNGKGRTSGEIKFKQPQRKRDTIPVICQVVDTSHEFYLPDDIDSVTKYGNDNFLYWRKGKTIIPIDLGMKSKLEPYTTMLYSVREQEQRDDCSKCWPTWKHLYYLDKYQNQLEKNIVVLQSQYIK